MIVLFWKHFTVSIYPKFPPNITLIWLEIKEIVVVGYLCQTKLAMDIPPVETVSVLELC